MTQPAMVRNEKGAFWTYRRDHAACLLYLAFLDQDSPLILP